MNPSTRSSQEVDLANTRGNQPSPYGVSPANPSTTNYASGASASNPNTVVNVPYGSSDNRYKGARPGGQVGSDWAMVYLWIFIFGASVPVWAILTNAGYFTGHPRTYLMFVGLSTTLISMFMIPYWLFAQLQHFWRHGQNISPAARIGGGLLPAFIWLGLWGGACAVIGNYTCDPPNTDSTVCNWNGAILAMSILTSFLWLLMTYLLTHRAISSSTY